MLKTRHFSNSNAMGLFVVIIVLVDVFCKNNLHVVRTEQAHDDDDDNPGELAPPDLRITVTNHTC